MRRSDWSGSDRAPGLPPRKARRSALLAALPILAASWALSPAARAQNAEHPLESPDTSSPRATINTLIATGNEAYGNWAKGEGRTYRNLAQRMAMAHRMTSLFDLSDIAPSLRMNEAREASVYLKEIFDRIDLPPMSEIPDAAAIAAMPGGLAHWTIPHTEIALVRIKAGLQEGQYVFSAETDDRAREFYLRVKHLTYKPGATVGLYDWFSSEPGWMIPRAWVHALPAWARTRHGGQAVWQWIGLAITLLVAALAMILIYRIGGRCARHGQGLRYYLAIVFPVFAMLVPATAIYFLGNGVFITGNLLTVLEFTLHLISLGALVVVILSVANRLANAAASLRWFQPRSADAQLVQLLIRACGVAGSVVALLEGGRYLGVPLTTLIAGASVSGLAVALAAQESLKNLFGGLMIVLDKPFRVGDVIRIKGYEGTVELIGLRSSRLRMASGNVVTIANEEMARLDSENFSRRAHLRRSETIRLRSDTPLEKIRRAAEIVRAVLDGHEGLDPKLPPSVRVTGIGPDAVSVTMTYWYHPPDQAAFAAFNEQISLRLLEQFQAEGIRLA
jgi:MscS family membrane protein